MLIPRGRLLQLTAVALLNFTYSQLLANQDAEGRKKLILTLEGRLGQRGGEIVEDEDLPESMQGLEAPTWWTSDHDPFADQQQIG